MNVLTKRYQSEPKALRLMRSDIRFCARADGFSETEVGEIVIASGEAFTNAIEHGHVPGSGVDVIYSSDGNEIVITIKDAGGGLEPSQKTWNKIVDRPHGGGRGRLIMKALMDDVVMHIDPGDGTTVVMRIGLSA